MSQPSVWCLKFPEVLFNRPEEDTQDTEPIPAESLETGGTSPQGSTETWDCQEAEGLGDRGKRLYCSFLGRTGEGKAKDLELVSLLPC